MVPDQQAGRQGCAPYNLPTVIAIPLQPMPIAPLDIESLIAAIKREALARGDTQPFNERTDEILGREREARGGAGSLKPPTRAESLRDWMPFHGKPFIISAYRTLLLRDPDQQGLDHFSRMIAEGHLTRWEVVGRLRLSGEGRVRRIPVKGLWLGFALATAYRVPIAGPLLAWSVRVLRIPPYLQDNGRDERLIAQLLAGGR